MSTAAEKSAERRRKIMARQKDRMAFATGTTDTLQKEMEAQNGEAGKNGQAEMVGGAVGLGLSAPADSVVTGPDPQATENGEGAKDVQAEMAGDTVGLGFRGPTDDVLPVPDPPATDSRTESVALPESNVAGADSITLQGRSEIPPGMSSSSLPAEPRLKPAFYGETETRSSPVQIPKISRNFRLAILAVTAVMLVFFPAFMQSGSAVQAFFVLDTLINLPNIMSLVVLYKERGLPSVLFQVPQQIRGLVLDVNVFFFCFFFCLHFKANYTVNRMTR